MSDVTSSGLGTTVTTSGAANNIFTIQGGTRNTSNLFHSFGDFDLVYDATNPESAVFSNNQGGTIANVIGRITGGASNIDGNISFDGTLSGANLFLINPAGLIFGEHSSINIPGSFHASTANVINLGSDVFGAATTVGDIGGFSTSSPTSFGFLAGNTSALKVFRTDFTVGTDETISLVGSNVDINAATFTANSGRINVLGVDSSVANATVSNINSGTPTITGTRGDIILNNSRIDVSGLSTAMSADANGAGGDVYIIGGAITLDNTVITSELFSNATSGNIVLNGTGAVLLSNTDINTGHDQGLMTDDIVFPGFTIPGIPPFIPDIVIPGFTIPGVNIPAVVKGTGAAGDVFITGDTVTIEDGSNIFSRTEALSGEISKDSGSVSIFATNTADVADFATFTGAPLNADIVINNSTIFSEAAGGGRSGDVNLKGSGGGNVDTLYILDSDISTIIGDSALSAGTIDINADNSLIRNSTLHSDTVGTGDAGVINIRGTNLLIDMTSALTSNVLTDNAMAADPMVASITTGDTGDVDINVSDFFRIDGSTISATTEEKSTGNAGFAHVIGGTVEVVNSTIKSDTSAGFGTPGQVWVRGINNGASSTVTVTNSTVSSNTNDGNAGNLDYVWLNTTGTGVVDGGSKILSTTVGNGQAASVYIWDGDWTITGAGTEISSSQLGTDAGVDGIDGNLDDQDLGGAGEINIGTNIGGSGGTNVNSLVVEMGAVIRSDTLGDGGVTGSTASNAGAIYVQSDGDVTIQSGAKISSSSDAGIGDAGLIEIDTATAFNLTGANTAISTNTSEGAGGNIDITVGTTGDINTGGQISSNTDGDGDAGSISLNSGDWTLNGNGFRLESKQTATNGLGDAGDISITADNIFFESGADITSTTDSFAALVSDDTSDAGSITLTAGVIDLDGTGLTKITSEAVANNSVGDAGSITFNATTLHVDFADVFAQNRGGGGGLVDFNIAGTATIDGFTFVRAGTLGAGDAGSVELNATDFVLDDRSYLRSTSSGSGAAGSVSVTATNSATITNRSDLTSDATGTGDAGLVTVLADTFFLDNSQIKTNNINGAGGNISITATTQGDITNLNAGDMLNGTTVAFTNKTIISSSTSGIGNAGSVSLLGGVWNISGDTVDTGDGSELGMSTIISSSQTNTGAAIGDAGDVSINASSVNITDFAQITSDTKSASTMSDAGNVSIVTTGDLNINTSSNVSSSADEGVGEAGSITLDANNLTLDGVTISTQTSNGALGLGAINLNATTMGIITNGDTTAPQTTVQATTDGSGIAGKISITGGTWLIEGENVGADGSEGIISGGGTGSTIVSSGSTGSGAAGDVDINVNALTITDFAQVSSDTINGQGGNVVLTVATTGLVSENAEVTANTTGTGQAGNVVLNGLAAGQGDWTVNTNAVISSNANTGANGTGNAGRVVVDSNTLLVDNAILSTGTADGTDVDAGLISIDVDTSLTLQNSAAVLSGVGVDGGAATATGSAGQIFIVTDSGGATGADFVLVTGNSKIASGVEDGAVNGTGNAGSISIATDTFTLTGTDSEVSTTNINGTTPASISVEARTTGSVRLGGQILSNTIGDGDAGAVSITGGSWTLTGFSNMGTDEVQIESSQTTDGNYAAGGRVGDAGQIDIVVDRLELEQGGRISSSTTSDATLGMNVSDAGDVNITADDGVMGTNDLIISSGITFNFFGFTFTFPTAISGISANSNNGIGDAGQIIINAGSALLSDALIQTRTNSGIGGDIRITVDEKFDANSGVAITSDTVGSGTAGRIDLNGGAGSDWDLTGVNVNTSAGTMASGGAGDISIDVDNLLLDGDTQIASDSTATEAGLGGTAGTAGQIRIASNTFTLDGATIATNTVDGNVDGVDPTAGQVSVTVNTGIIRNTGIPATQISSSTTGMGDAGSVSLDAETWSITGDAVANMDGSEGIGSTVIRSTTTSSGNAGQVAVTADTSIIVDDFAVITSSAGNGSTGNAGQVGLSTEEDGGDVAGDSIMILGDSQISSNSTEGTAMGAAGEILIVTDDFTLDGASISTQTDAGTDLTNATAQVGSITITAVNGVVQNTSAASRTSISANTLGAGQAGDITLDGGDWTITGNAVADVGVMDVNRSTRVTSGTAGSGSAGFIDIVANSILSITDYALVATASAINTSGNAGQVGLRAGTTITLDNNAKISSITTTNTTGNAGLVGLSTEMDGGDIAGDSIIIQGDAVVTSSSSLGMGAAGNIQIDTDNFTLDGGTVSSVTNLGLLNGGGGATQQGSITINAKTLGTVQNSSVASPTLITADTVGSGPAGDITLNGLDWNITGNATDTAMSRSTVISSNTSAGTGDAGQIDIAINGDLSISQFAQIATNTQGTSTGGAGDISLDANNSVSIDTQAEVASNSITSGAAGSVTITTDLADAVTTDFVAITNGAEVSSGSAIDGMGVGTGAAGNVSITTDLLTVNAGEITTETENGAGGNVLVTTKVANIENGSDITADSDGTGDAGTVTFNSTTSLNINSGSEVSSNSNDGTGSAGSVTLTTADLDVDNATVATVNSDGANPASITIAATSGVATATFSNNAQITANTEGTGPAGDILITAGDILVQTNSVISSSSQTGTGSAGSVSMTAGDITINNASVRTVNNAGVDQANITLNATNPSTGIITNGAVVTASTVGTGDAGSISLLGPNWIVNGSTTQVTSSTSGDGDAGQITATTGNFLLDAATISTNSTSAGDSGAILINSGLITLTNGGTIQSNVSGTGDGGVVTLTSASDIFLSSGAEVSTNTTPNAAPIIEGDAGNIFVNAVGSLNMVSSLLTSSTTSDGQAGTVTINTGDSVYLLDSTILVDSTGATTAGVGGGNLNVTTGILVLDSSTLDASAGSGTGGNVSITADFFFISPDSVIDVSSGSGASGTVSVNAVAVDLSGSLNALKVKFKDSGKLLRQACATKGATSSSSSFIVNNGIEGIPSSPVDFQSGSTLDVIVAPNVGGVGLNSSSSPTAVSPTGTALFAAIACGGF